MKLLVIIATILSSFLTNLETKTLQSGFTVTVSETANAPMNIPGTIVMCGDKFRLEMLDLNAAYDGQTMYMYSGQTDELTLTNPARQELIETNPFLYAKTMVDVCNVVERTDGEQTVVTLTPFNQAAGINRFVLRLRTADLMPLQLEIKEGNKTSVLKMKEPKFVSDPQQYVLTPGKDTFVNDMRL